MSLALRQLSTADTGFDADLARLLHAGSPTTDREIEQRVAEILADVRARGDVALLEYTARFDRVQAASVAALELGQGEMRAAFDALPAAQRAALEAAAARGATARPTARCSARRSRRSTGSASTCRAARRPIRRAC